MGQQNNNQGASQQQFSVYQPSQSAASQGTSAQSSSSTPNLAASSYPVYTLKPNITRLLVPKAGLLCILSILLYLGVYFNLKFLNIGMSFYYNIGAIVMILLICSFDLLFEYSKALHKEYRFYADRLQIGDKFWLYSSISHIDTKRNKFDDKFDTCTIVAELNPNLASTGKKSLSRFEMDGVPDQLNIYQYMKNIIKSQHQA